MNIKRVSLIFGLLPFLACGQAKKSSPTAPGAQTKPDQPTPVTPEPEPPSKTYEDAVIRYLGGQLTIGGKGQFGAAGFPGARRQGVHWTGRDGLFYLFGGEGFGEKSLGRLNDFWSYDPRTAAWTWLGGETIPKSWNLARPSFPGARSGAMSWTGADGRLWLFGGFTHLTATGLGYSQDLWSYTPETRAWQWISGKGLDQVNQPAMPAGREGAAVWTDKAGRLWMFGGQRRELPAGDLQPLNDLWKYDPESKVWEQIATQEGPRPRLGAASWVDASGHFWLFGGFGAGHFNELWRLNPETAAWMRVSGSSEINAPGVWGSRGIGAAGQTPSAREAPIAWSPDGHRLCLMGGWGYGVYHLVGEPDALQDLWCFDPSTGFWTWWLGENFSQERSLFENPSSHQPGSAGFPGARYGSSFWVGAHQDLFLFGGTGYDINGRGDLLQDFWRLPLNSQE